jgi:hypothetical protein
MPASERDAMSDAHVEFIRRAVQTGNDSGWDVKALAPFVHQEGRLHNPARFPGPQLGHGTEGLDELLRQWLAQFGDFQLRSERIFEHEGQVVALLRALGTSRASGAQLDWPIGAVFSGFDEDGPPREIRWFMEWDEALAAAGVEAAK